MHKNIRSIIIHNNEPIIFIFIKKFQFSIMGCISSLINNNRFSLFFFRWSHTSLNLTTYILIFLLKILQREWLRSWSLSQPSKLSARNMWSWRLEFKLFTSILSIFWSNFNILLQSLLWPFRCLKWRGCDNLIVFLEERPWLVQSWGYARRWRL